MTEFQVRKDNLAQSRLVSTSVSSKTVPEGSVVAQTDCFAFTSNNITYGVAGDMLGYWQFFPPAEDDGNTWGVLPVWGFADVTHSNCSQIDIGERLFGYFPPSSHLLLRPASIKDTVFFDGSEHRASLPAGYNRYRRVSNEPGYSSAGDNRAGDSRAIDSRAMDELQALLFPLYITSFCLWDALTENHWHGAEQIIIMSASSKTSIGLGYALAQDASAPAVLGLTSMTHCDKLGSLNLYGNCIAYDNLADVPNVPSVIVDMSGNSDLLGRLHTLLGDNMKQTLNVGVTHWEQPRKREGIISDRCEMFFAPSHIQQRFREWGPEVFEQRSTSFLNDAFSKSMSWLNIERLDGLPGLVSVYADVCAGTIPLDKGLIIKM